MKMGFKTISTAKLKEMIESALSKNSINTNTVQELEVYIKYKDIFFYTWKTFAEIILRDEDNENIYMLNIINLMEKISLPKKWNSDDGSDGNSGYKMEHGPQNFILNMKLLKKFVNKVWESLISRKLSLLLHQKLLFLLVESYLSWIDNPIFLTDFLMASLNFKGIISILALQGMAQLMQKNNIEYPNIYTKLYSMFEPEMLHKQFKSRLFYLADIFLTSTHLPGALVASFAKRASRLSLFCSAPDVLIILKFVENLLIRHSVLQKMIHDSEGSEVECDPFLMEEKDPMKTRAIESSLWEISLMKNHCQPSISITAQFIDSNLPKVELDLSENLNKNYENIFESEQKKKFEIPSLTFQKPSRKLADLKDDKLFKLWDLNASTLS